MIYGSIYDERTYAFLPSRLKEALAFARSHDFAVLPTGTKKIAGDDIYVNIARYTTGAAAEKIWEAHRTYIDIHVLAEGTERIDVNLIERMQMGDYDAARDFTPAEGDAASSTIMRPGDFLVCFPTDVHRSGVMVDAPAPLIKGIFKIKESLIK